MQFYDITGLDPYEMANVTLLATTGGGTSVPSLRESGRTSQAGIHWKCELSVLLVYCTCVC